METDETDIRTVIDNNVEDSYSAINSSILDYYKKFGRKRDLEQFFSLSTTQSDIRDPSSVFWRRMKSHYDSSDSGENKKSESSTELCRISIKCSIPEPSSSQLQDDNTRIKMDSNSPPIIREDVMEHPCRSSDNDSDKSNDVQSRKSNDCTLDTSMNKPISPTSSITSQRKLEWDSLADVGYANENDRKNSASSLSTLERMALQQQYSNESKHNPELEPPTAHSTPLDDNDITFKSKKSETKKTKIYKRDVDLFELNIPQTSEYMKPINVNLTKHISFNVEKDGGVSVENMTKSISLSPEKVSTETAITPQVKIDKEIQTTLIKSKDNSVQLINEEPVKNIPVLISLNTLRKRVRKKKVRKVRKQNGRKINVANKENIPEKHVEQVSEAESFEYMPGHIYNQNQLKISQDQMNPGNKSSLESSAGLTTDSSKTTKYSFAKDLERSIDMLKNTLDSKCDDSNLKKRLIKEVVQRLIKSKYKDDESSTEFLSGLTFNSKKLDLYNTNQTTTSTSEGTMKKDKVQKPKKSILRMDKFNSGPIASTSQSVPNLHTVSNSDNKVDSRMGRNLRLSITDSDVSGKNKKASDTGVNKTSSEQLYQKYLEALKREQVYKKHLKDKELFLKQKLVSSDRGFNFTRQADIKTQNKIKNLMKDLIRNNYDDGSGDASKLEVGSSSNLNLEGYNCITKQRSHSVFTLSSGNSNNHYIQAKPPNKCTQEADTSKPSINISEKHYCCCPYHKSHPKIGVTDSSVQVDLKCCKDVSPERNQGCSSSRRLSPASNHIQELGPFRCEKCNTVSKPRKIAKCLPETGKDDIQYVCLCTQQNVTTAEIPENIFIYKCSRLNNKCPKMDTVSKTSNTPSCPSSDSTSPRKISTFESRDCDRKCLIIKDSNGSNSHTKSSQTDLNFKLPLRQVSSEQSTQSSSSENKSDKHSSQCRKPSVLIHEATRTIQTEISIDPKISDPSISDINIVNDDCCVQLISEQYKEVSRNTSENNVTKRVDREALYVSDCDLNEARSNEKKPAKYVSVKTKDTSTNTIEKIDKEIQSSPEVSKGPISNDKNKKDPNNFTIPIQGTNMTLKVSLGSENRAVNNILYNTKTSVSSKGTETVKNAVVDNFTSLRDECSKGVQSTSNNIFKDFYEKPRSTYCEINTYKAIDSEMKSDENSKLPTKCCHVNTCITDNKFNTYPKNDKINAQKPLLRSNTDTGKMERSCRVTFNKVTTKDEGVQPDPITHQKQSKSIATANDQDKYDSCCSEKSVDTSCKSKLSSDIEDQLKPSNSETDSTTIQKDISRDPLLEMIQDITKRYSKKDFEKNKRNKCFKELITVLNYFLDTEESTDQDQNKASCSSACNDNSSVDKIKPGKECCDSIANKTLVDKSIQLSTKKSKTNKNNTESSDLPISTDFPSTSSDSATCKILNKIKRECEKYHQKRCKSNSGIKHCEASSSTSVNCEQCRRVHHCSCRGHKCKSHKTKTTVEKTKRKCVAYNLIIQTSDSLISEEVTCRNKRQLQNIIVKVPSRRKVENIPFKEMAANIERDLPHFSPRCGKNCRSKSCPNESEISSTEEIIRKAQEHTTVREYLEKNRPDFVEKSSSRQHCLKMINETRPKFCESPQLRMLVVHTPRCGGNTCMDPCNIYCGGMPINNWSSCVTPYNMHCGQNEVTRIANERSTKRQLLSLQLDRQQTLGGLTNSELKNLARELGNELRRKKVTPKFINEREMKKHSEKIYKSLPEVTRKKEEMKKENMKKTNLLMANIFKKNLQRKTLSGAVNLSNYSTVVKI